MIILLDYEIETNGLYYQDPLIPDSQITWQYTVVKPDYSFPPVKYEILAELFLFDDIEVKSSSFNNMSWSDLENKALEITGNLDDEIQLKSSSWRPAGRIMVQDDVLDRNIPLVACIVRATRWFTTHKDDTDSEGYFSCDGTFKRDATYSIKWERAYWDIRDGNIGQAYYNGPKQSGDWNLNITAGKSLKYGTLHRAAVKHFYGDNLGITRPIIPDGSKTKICYIDDVGSSSGVYWGDWSSTGVIPDIKIWGKNPNGSYRKTQAIFGAITHELGHQSHSVRIGNVNFWITNKIIYESWAEAVEWALTNDEYHKLGVKYSKESAKLYNHLDVSHDDWPLVPDIAYSPIFIDLVDTRNQRVIFGNSYPNDLISGYTLNYINNYFLYGTYNINDLYGKVKSHKITGVTDEMIDELFELY